MRVFILLGHPNTDTLSGSFADTYQKAAEGAGHEVRRLNLGDLSFDPILHKGYRVIQELEPDLKLVQGHMKWCDHFVLVYPLWWSATPALLKGMFDRMWLPGFASNFYKDRPGWKRLLKGKTARLIVLSKQPLWQIWLLFGDCINEVARATLGFSGMKVRLTKIGHSENLTPIAKQAWFSRIASLGRRAR